MFQNYQILSNPLNEFGYKMCAITCIDDCSRLVSAYVCDGEGGKNARIALEGFIGAYGKLKVVQTDNGVEFTYRYISFLNSTQKKKAMLCGFEQILQEHNIHHHLIKPRTPQLNGKIERFHLSL